MAAAIALSPAGHLLAAPQYWDTDGSVVGNDTTTGAGLGGTGNWSTAISFWWDGNNPGVLAGWTEGNDAFFLGTPGVVTLSGPRTTNSLTFGSSGYTVTGLTGNTLTLTGAAGFHVLSGTGTVGTVLAGTAGYNKTGPGTLLLNTTGTSTNTGPVNVIGGVLEISTAARIGGTGVGAGVLTLNGGTLRNDDPANGNTWLTANRPISIGVNGGTFDAPTSGVALIYTGSVTGSGNTLNKIGAGEFRAQGANTALYDFSKLVVRGGLYRLGSVTGSNFETGFGAAPGVFTPDAITLNNGAIGTSFPVSLHPNRGITLGPGGGTYNSSTGAATIQSSITGVGGLTRTGVQNVRFTASSDFQGTFTLLDNRVEVWANNALGVGNLAITLSGTNSGTIANNAPSGTNVVLTNPIITLSNSGSGQIDIAANSGNTLELTGKITGGANWKRDNGSSTGTLVLSNSTSDFTGGLTVTTGRLVITANNALGSAAGATTINSAAAIGLRGGFDYTTPEPLTIGGSGISSTGAIVNFQDNNRFAGPITMTANSGVGVTSGQLELAGPISGSFRLQKEGPGTLVLAHPGNSFGSMAVNAGTVVVSADGNLGAAPLAFSANNVQLAITALRATSSFSVHPNRGINLVSNGSIDVSTSITLTYPGTMGGGALNKMGAGTLVLSGVNAHTGGTTIHAGTLSLTSTGVLPGDVTIAPGAALHGSGSVGGNVTVGGTLSPGASPGALTTTGSHTWQGGGAYTWEIDNATGAPVTNWDRVTMNAVTISATATNKFTIRIVALPGGGGPALDNFDPDAPASWVIATATSGTVTNFDLEAFEIDASQFEQNNENKGGFYVSRSSGDLMLNYVPEPSGGVLLALAATITLRRRRRRSR